jgi:ubiquinone/menaquinone biosynthesis C-methylase UbiE
MRAQRPPHLPRAIDAAAERLPLPDRSFDASMATYSVHQWSDLQAGLAEMRRVTIGPVLILSCDPQALDRFWLHDYAPEVIAVEAGRYPRSASDRNSTRPRAAFRRWSTHRRYRSPGSAGFPPRRR